MWHDDLGARGGERDVHWWKGKLSIHDTPYKTLCVWGGGEFVTRPYKLFKGWSIDLVGISILPPEPLKSDREVN
jgi:hypothetical protein